MPQLILYAGTDRERVHECTFADLVTYDRMIDRTPDGTGPKTREQAAELALEVAEAGSKFKATEPRRGRRGKPAAEGGDQGAEATTTETPAEPAGEG